MLEEFCRAHPANVRPEVFRRWQRTIRDDIAPKLAVAEQLAEDNAQLKAKLEKALTKKAKGAATE
jgi:hypothetical protein